MAEGQYFITTEQGKISAIYLEGLSPDIPDGVIPLHPDDVPLVVGADSWDDYSVDANNRLVSDNAALHDKVRAAKKEEMKEACKRECQQGVVSSALGAPHRYGTRTYPRHDQANLNAVAPWAMRHKADPAWSHELPCSADDGVTWTRKPHNADQCLRVIEAVNALITTAMGKLQQRKDEIDATVDQAVLDAITWI